MGGSAFAGEDSRAEGGSQDSSELPSLAHSSKHYCLLQVRAVDP